MERTEEMNELKPCPFCGSKKVAYARSFVGIYMIKCFGCGTIVSFAGKEEKDEASEAWNTRAKERL